MADAGWFLVISAIAIPLLTALVARAATRYSAHLQAQQKRRDAELKQLSDLRDALLEALTAVQSYVMFVERADRKSVITPETWLKVRPLLEPALLKTQRLDSLASALPHSSELRDVYRQLDSFLMTVLQGIGDDGIDAWDAEAERKPTRAAIAVERTAREIEKLLATYPTKIIE